MRVQTVRSCCVAAILVVLTIPGVLLAEEGGPGNLQELIQALEAKDALVRLRAAKTLGEMGAEAQPAVEALRKALNDEDEDVRLVAKRALERIELENNPELTQLIADLKNPDPLTRLRAAKKLGELGSKATVAIPALEKLLQDKDGDVRQVAQHAIEKIKSSGSPKVQQLIEQLRDEDAVVRLSAAKQLGEMGEDGRPAMEPLKEACQDPDEVVRMVAKNALDKLKKATNVAVDEGGVKLTQAVEKVTVTKVERIFSPTEVSASGFTRRPASMRFFVTLKNTADHPTQVGTLRVRWFMGQEEIHNDDASGPILPLLAGQTCTHTFPLRWDRDSRWDRRTKATVEVALATPIELDQADRLKLEMVRNQCAKLRVLNAQPIYRYGILMGDQFTIQNTSDQICKGMYVALQGYDSTNEWICSLLYHIPIVPKGYTHVTNDPSKAARDKRSLTKLIDYQYAKPDPQIKRMVATVLGVGLEQDELR